MIALLVITDGRDDYLNRTVESARDNLRGPVTERWMYDDTGDDTYRTELADRFPDFRVIDGGARQGFGGAIRAAWRHLARSNARFVFHLEADFTFNEPVDLLDMAKVLDRNPHLQQLALRRQPWNAEEAAAGGVVEQHPDDYLDCSDGVSHWLEQRRFFTTNPCLYRRSLIARDWPTGEHSEGRFGLDLFAHNPEWVSGFWGRRTDPPKVHHIGDHRAGVGY